MFPKIATYSYNLHLLAKFALSRSNGQANGPKKICNDSVQFRMEKQKNEPLVVVRVLKKTQTLIISRCCFAEDGKEMYKDL